MYIKKGDNIIVLSGKDKGKKGKVMRAFPHLSRVLVEGVNMAKRHQKPRRTNQKGEILSVPMPLPVSNVALIDPKSGKPTRVGLRRDGGKVARVAKRSGAEV